MILSPEKNQLRDVPAFVTRAVERFKCKSTIHCIYAMFFSNAVFVSFLRKESFEVAPWQTYKPHYLLLSVVEKKKKGRGGGCQMVWQQCLQKSLSKVLKPSPSKRQKMTAPYTAVCVGKGGRQYTLICFACAQSWPSAVQRHADQTVGAQRPTAAPGKEYSRGAHHLLVQTGQKVCQDDGQDVEEAKVNVKPCRVLRQAG